MNSLIGCFPVFFLALAHYGLVAKADPSLEGQPLLNLGEQRVEENSFHDEGAEKKAAQQSLLKGKVDYSQQVVNRQRVDGEAGDPLGDVPGEVAGDLVPLDGGDKEISRKRQGVGSSASQPAPPTPSPSSSSTSAIALPDLKSWPKKSGGPLTPKEQAQEQLKKYGDQVKDTGLGMRLYQRVRVRQCVGWCKNTLPPWYSDLAAVNCNRTNSCLKSPESGAECQGRCEGIVKDLPTRPVLSCKYYCDLAYGGLAKTLEFCKGRCPQ